MVDYRKLLDAFVGAVGRGEPQQDQQGAPGAKDEGPPQNLARQLETGVTQLAGQSPHQLLQKAKDLAAQHPGVAQAALVGLAGLLFGRRKKGKLTGSLVKLGGLAVIGGLAYRAHQNQQGGGAADPQAQGQGAASRAGTADGGAVAQAALSLPETSRFHPVSQTEDDALLFLRTMVAAATSDGRIDEAERRRIANGLAEAGIDDQASRWLEREMASPADVEELAANVNDPEKAAQVYAAARIAIDPDTIQEREFLHQLAEALDLDPATRAQIDETATALS